MKTLVKHFGLAVGP